MKFLILSFYPRRAEVNKFLYTLYKPQSPNVNKEHHDLIVRALKNLRVLQHMNFMNTRFFPILYEHGILASRLLSEVFQHRPTSHFSLFITLCERVQFELDLIIMLFSMNPRIPLKLFRHLLKLSHRYKRYLCQRRLLKYSTWSVLNISLFSKYIHNGNS
jgi:hypothetical protein